MKKLFIILGLIIVVILILTLPLADETSDTERVIVDHTHGIIIHPNCFEEETMTNYIDEVSFSNAVDNYGYEISGECSEAFLSTGKTSVIQKIFE